MTHTKTRREPLSDLVIAAMAYRPSALARNARLLLEACALVDGLDDALRGCAACFDVATADPMTRPAEQASRDYCRRCERACGPSYATPRSHYELQRFPHRSRLSVKFRASYGTGQVRAAAEAHCIARTREGVLGLLERWVILDLERVSRLQLITPRSIADTIACVVETYDDHRVKHTREGRGFGHSVVVVDGQGDDLRVVDAVTQVWGQA